MLSESANSTTRWDRKICNQPPSTDPNS